MKVTQVTENVYRLSANLGEDVLFEGFWPLPHGVSLNAYVVKGEKTALIDGVGAWSGVPEVLLRQFTQMNMSVDDIDYVIVNHLEPDHTGWLVRLNEMRKDVPIYTSERGAAMMKAFFGIEKGVTIVKNGDTLDLGNGYHFTFYEIPNVHWPETVATYESKTKTLFSCDAFGAFGAITDAPYDDQLDEGQIAFFEREALRYYANIVASFSIAVEKAIEKLAPLDIKIIAPSHGIVWRKNPKKIIDDYMRYASYRGGPAKPEITVIWGSMYGNTEKAVKPLLEGIESEGVKAHVCKIPQTHISHILASVWESTGVVLGMPTYEYKMYPPMAEVLDELARKRAFNKKAFRFGSFGWSGGAQKELDEMMERLKMKWDFLEPVEFNGAPSPGDLEKIRQRGAELAKKVKEAALQ